MWNSIIDTKSVMATHSIQDGYSLRAPAADHPRGDKEKYGFKLAEKENHLPKSINDIIKLIEQMLVRMLVFLLLLSLSLYPASRQGKLNDLCSKLSCRAV